MYRNYDLNQFLSFKSAPSYFQQSSAPFTHSISKEISSSTQISEHKFSENAFTTARDTSAKVQENFYTQYES